MKRHFLEFEKPIAELTNKITELRQMQDESAVNISSEIELLQTKVEELTKDIYSQLGAWEI